MNEEKSNNQYKVSVIVPVFNPGPGMKRCIKSLREQTLHEIEILFIDDCSTDNSLDILSKAAEKDKRIRVLKNETNRGQGFARNRGIEAAQGEYLSFVDPDDYLAADFLESLYSKAIEDNTNIVKALMICEKSDGAPMWPKPQANKLIREKLAKGIPLYRAFTRGHQTAIYRREFILSKGIRYGLARRDEDRLFLLRTCSKTESISIIENTFYYYCEREGSAMKSMGVKQLGHYFESFHEIAEYCVNDLPQDVYTKDYLIELFLAGLREIYRYKDILGMENDLRYYAGVLCSEWESVPEHDRWAEDCFSLQALRRYGSVLPAEPFISAWEGTLPPLRFAVLLECWLDFYLDTPEERKASLPDLEKIIAKTGAAISMKSNRYYSEEEKKRAGTIVKKQMRRSLLHFQPAIAWPLCKAVINQRDS